MDRYWITREQHGLNKISIPSPDEMKKYCKGEDNPKKDASLASKAEICAEIIKLRSPRYSDREIVHNASELMKLNMDSLLKLREYHRQIRRVKGDKRS
jgi:hypothetical protein